MRKLNLQFFGEPAEQKDAYGQMDFTIDFKASAEEKGVIEGYAAAYGNLDRQGDVLIAGAFSEAKGKIPIFGMHNPREGIGTGTVVEDEKGLKIKIKLAIDNQDSEILANRAKEYYAMAKEGIISRMSVGFITQKTEWKTKKEADGRERYYREVHKGDLVEVSLVPVPANDRARITNVKDISSTDIDKIAELEKRIAELEGKLAEQKGDEEEKDAAKNEFMKQCHHRLKNRYPDQKQRTAICLSEWEKGGKSFNGTNCGCGCDQKDQQQTDEKSLSYEHLIAQRLGLF